MALVTRRGFLRAAAGGAGLLSVGGYAFGIEPGFILTRTTYHMTPPAWPADLHLRIGVISDVHACEPWMPASRVRAICNKVNALHPDIIVLLGDYTGGHMMVTGPVMPEAWGEAMSVLRAPYGVYGVLGNHDLWHGALPNMPALNGDPVRKALRDAGVTVMENDAVRVVKDGQAFWIVGLADQLALRRSHREFIGMDDLPGSLARVTDDAPVILLAHEPYIFPQVPQRVALTLSGHTHGGQVRLPEFAQPLMSPRMRWSQTYGHIAVDNKHMIVSAGLGTSLAPVRFMRPPEIVDIVLGSPQRIS